MHNPDCDGNGPHDAREVRVLPLPGKANLNLCARCFGRELRWRYERNRGLGREARYTLPSWESLRELREAEREALPEFQDSRDDATGCSA